jgi:hypothetical protein
MTPARIWLSESRAKLAGVLWLGAWKGGGDQWGRALCLVMVRCAWTCTVEGRLAADLKVDAVWHSVPVLKSKQV